VKDCCKDPANRTEAEQLPNGATLQKCTVCGCRHFELAVDPVQVGVKLDG
jgi:hypothetical protein